MKHPLLAFVLLTAPLSARPYQVTLTGTVVHQQEGSLWVKAPDGSQWQGILLDKQSPLPQGKPLLFRLVGSLSERPRRIDLWADGSQPPSWREKGIPTPGFVRQGTWPGLGGVGGTPPGAPDPALARRAWSRP